MIHLGLVHTSASPAASQTKSDDKILNYMQNLQGVLFMHHHGTTIVFSLPPGKLT